MTETPLQGGEEQLHSDHIVSPLRWHSTATERAYVGLLFFFSSGNKGSKVDIQLPQHVGHFTEGSLRYYYMGIPL